MKTFAANSETVDRRWYIVDAEGQSIGRLASVVASLLKGKHKVDYTPNVDNGDFVIVLNADKIAYTAKKGLQKLYRRHSGYPGGFKELTLNQMMERSPERVLEKAIWGMLPHNRLGRRQFTKLKVFTGAEHPHAAQQPKLIDLNAAARLQIQEVSA